MNSTNYEIFISFKDRDDNGNRTASSLLANRIYDSLDVKNYCVFFSRETMNNSASKEFELEIDYALKTSKLLILVFTKADELHSEWVKKEWKEFLKSDKSIIPVFMNLPVGDMAKVPDDIRCLQGFDLSFDDDHSSYNDLISTVVKIMRQNDHSSVSNEDHYEVNVGNKNDHRNEPQNNTFAANKKADTFMERKQSNNHQRATKANMYYSIKSTINWMCVLGFVFFCSFPVLLYNIRIKGNDEDFIERFRSISAVDFIMRCSTEDIHFFLPAFFCVVMLILFRIFSVSNNLNRKCIIWGSFGSLTAQLPYVFLYLLINPPFNTILEQICLFSSVYFFSVMDIFLFEDDIEKIDGFDSFFMAGLCSLVYLIPSFTLLLPRWWGFIISDLFAVLICGINITVAMDYNPNEKEKAALQK